MRLVSLALAFLTWSTLAGAQPDHVALEIELEEIIETYSFQTIVSEQIGPNCQTAPNVPRTLCAITSNDRSMILPRDAVLSRTRAIEKFNNPTTMADLYDGALLLYAAQLVVFRHEYSDAKNDGARQTAFEGLSLLYDQMSPVLSQTGDADIARLSVWMAAQLRVEATTRDLSLGSPTKRLTNLGNALNRYFDRSGDILALQTAKEIHETILGSPLRPQDAISEARARLNLGNTYTRLGAAEGIENGRIWNGRAVVVYAPGIERLKHETSSTDQTANRLMTGLIAQMAQSMLSSPGDEYLNHRKAIATLKYARSSFSDRLSDQRRVEFFLAEVGARIQIIDRLALPEQQEVQIDDAMELFEREAPDAEVRRPAPDTALGVHTSGASLFAFRGSLTGSREDCEHAESHLIASQDSIATNLAINQDRLVYSLSALLDCLVDVDPTTRGLDRLDPRRLLAKRRTLQSLVGDSALRPFASDELAAMWVDQTGGDRCAAAEIMFEATDKVSRVIFPEFWELTAVGKLCRTENLDTFVSDVREWLTEREQSRAQSRSGYALIARADLDAVTDLAIVLADVGRFDDVFWLLDFANRSRMSPGLESARQRMADLDNDARSAISDDILIWLENDNPGDPERSFEVQDFERGQVRLLSEVAAERQFLGRSPRTPTLSEVNAKIATATVDRTIAWLLLGNHASGWLVASSQDKEMRTVFVPIEITRADLQSILGTEHRAPVTGVSGGFFEARRNAGLQEGGDVAAGFELWQVALSNVSTELASNVIAPLYAVLTDEMIKDTPNATSLLTLVVRNVMADLPLHAISVGDAARDCGDTLISCFAVTWAGHAGSTNTTVLDPFDFETVPTFWGYENPDLGRQSLASYGQILASDGFDVTNRPDKVLNTLSQGPIGLWVLHGEYDPLDPGASRLGLQAGTPNHRHKLARKRTD